MRILVTGGGTGGHIYPALAVLEHVFSDANQETTRGDVAWVGTASGLEEDIIRRQGLTFYAVPAGAIRGVGPLTLLRNLGRIAAGFFEARQLIEHFRPDVVLATGGYVTVPPVLAARATHCPCLIYLPDLEPGWAVRLLSHLVDRVAVSFPEVTAHFKPGKAVVTGYPVRRALYETEPEEARRRLGLSDDPVLLVLGGSRGARSINMAVMEHIEALLSRVQLIHVCGKLDHPVLQGRRLRLPREIRSRYHLHDYLYDEMTDALVAADLVVARAGAATLGEFPAVGLPAILVPYPYAGRHQQLNADFLARHGAAIVLPDQALPEQLLATIESLLNDQDRLNAMAAAARQLAAPKAAETIADLLRQLAQRKREE